MASLKSQLETALVAAWEERETRRKIKLKGGLTIELYATSAGVIHLLLWRTKTAPSAQEWDTVMDHWPWVLPDPRPKPNPFISPGAGTTLRQCLSAKWKRPLPKSIATGLTTEAEAA